MNGTREMRLTKEPSPEKILAGLQAQIERSGRFASTIDPLPLCRPSTVSSACSSPGCRHATQCRAACRPTAFRRSPRTSRSAPSVQRQGGPVGSRLHLLQHLSEIAPPLVQACLANIARAIPRSKFLTAALFARSSTSRNASRRCLRTTVPRTSPTTSALASSRSTADCGSMQRRGSGTTWTRSCNAAICGRGRSSRGGRSSR